MRFDRSFSNLSAVRMARLEPCPFCGGKQPRLKSVEFDNAGDLAWQVWCWRAKCGAMGPSFLQTAEFQSPDPKQQAIDGWNTRKS
jgi:Lar family restriction alleviation protein